MQEFEEALRGVKHIDMSIEKETDQAVITKLTSDKAELSVDVLVEQILKQA